MGNHADYMRRRGVIQGSLKSENDWPEAGLVGRPGGSCRGHRRESGESTEKEVELLFQEGKWGNVG